MSVISPRAKIVVFALLIGVVLIILLSIAGFANFYNVKYIIVAPALIILLILMVLEGYRKKKQL